MLRCWQILRMRNLIPERSAEIDAEKGNIAQSYKGYTKAAELQPADADAKLGLAKTLIAMNQSDKALALLEDAVQLEPTNATAHYRLATLYRKAGAHRRCQARGGALSKI